MTVSLFLLALGAALRITRLGTEDSITQPFRNWLAARASRERTTPQGAKPARTAHAAMWAVQLFECPWCLGFWASVATITLAASSTDGGHTDGWFLYPALALTVSYLVGVVATIVYTIEEI